MLKPLIIIVSVILAAGYTVGYTDNYLISYPLLIIIAILLIDLFTSDFLKLFSRSLSSSVRRLGINHNIALAFAAGLIIGFAGPKTEKYEFLFEITGIIFIAFIVVDLFKKVRTPPPPTKKISNPKSDLPVA